MVSARGSLPMVPCAPSFLALSLSLPLSRSLCGRERERIIKLLWELRLKISINAIEIASTFATELNPILHGLSFRLVLQGGEVGWHKVPTVFFSETVKATTIKLGTLTN